MALLSSDWKKVTHPVKREFIRTSQVGGFRILGYWEIQERHYEWKVDNSGYDGAVIDPESLTAAGWGCAFHGPEIGWGEPHGVYKEIWTLEGSPVWL